MTFWSRSVRIFAVTGVWLLCFSITHPAGAEERIDVLPDLPVTSNELIGGARAQNSPMIAVDPTNEDFAVLANRWDAPDFACALQLSGDGGRTWTPADPVPELPSEAETCFAPEVIFDSSGTLYFSFLGLAGNGNLPVGVYLTTSEDRGRSFSPPRRLLGPNNFQVRMTIDPEFGESGRIYMMWLHLAEDPPTGGLPPTENPILLAFSDDRGKSFSSPIQVNDPERARSVAAAMTVAPDGRLHVLYYDLQEDFRDYQGLRGPTWEGDWTLVATSSTDGGLTFSKGVPVSTVVPPERVLLIYTMPPPALTASDGFVYAGWYDGSNGDWDVFLSRSGNGGATWEEPVRLNDDDIGNGKHQYLPSLAVGPDERVEAIFFDRRDDAQNVFNHTYYTVSRDDGQTFAPNIRISREASDSRIGQSYLVPSAMRRQDLGSRIALVATDDRSLAAWADTRNAPFTPYQDVFSTVIEHPSGASGVPTGLVVGLVGLAVAAATVLQVRRALRRPTPA